MNNSLHPPWEEARDPRQLRDLHVLYWTISQHGDPAFPLRTMEEFVEYFEGLDDRAQSEYVASLHRRYDQTVEQMVDEGVKIIEEYSAPESHPPKSAD